jgi:DNA-binding LytR/AlgR family response regulator
MDINLKGEMDGMETAKHIYKHFDIPVIFLTANADDATFQKAKSAKPYAFITKPFRQSDLQRAIELATERVALEKQNETADNLAHEEEEHSFILSDRIFVRHKDKMVKVFIQDILFAEADRNYCMVHTVDREYLLTVPLRVLEENLPGGKFMRVHRSYVVNLGKIDALGDNQEYLIFGKKNVPVSRRFKEDVLKRLKLI